MLSPLLAQATTDTESTLHRNLDTLDQLTCTLNTGMLPPSLRADLPERMEQRLYTLLNNKDEEREKNAESAVDFVQALVETGTHYSRLQEISNAESNINQYGDVTTAMKAISEAVPRVMPALERNQSRDVQNELKATYATALNHLAASALEAVDSAFAGNMIEEGHLRTAGHILHQAADLNGHVATNTWFSHEQRDVARNTSIQQHMALMRNDLLGYHRDGLMETAQDAVWHARRVYDTLYPDSEQRQMVLSHVQALASHFTDRVGNQVHETTSSFSPDHVATLVSLREIDELLLEHYDPILKPDKYAVAATRLIETYQRLGQYHEQIGDITGAISDYRNAIELSVEQKIIPSDGIIFGLANSYRERGNTVSPGDRQIVWYLRIQNDLKPMGAWMFSEDDARLLAGEITIYDEQLASEKWKEQPETARLAVAVIATVEEPSTTSIGFLKLLINEDDMTQAGVEEKSEEGKANQRLCEIARFLTQGWDDKDVHSGNSNLIQYQAAKREASYVDYDSLRADALNSGKASERAAAETHGVAVQMMIHMPERHQNSHIRSFLNFPDSQIHGSIAGCIVAQPMKTIPFGDAQIQLEEKFARRLDLPANASAQDVMSALHQPLSGDEVESVQAIAYLPVIPAPEDWVEQLPFYIKVTTDGDAVTYAFKEGQLVGSFITTNKHRSIDISHIVGGSDTSLMWKPQSSSGMSKEEKEKHGDLIGSIQLVTVPVKIINEPERGKGDGPNDITPVPPGGIRLSPVETTLASEYPPENIMNMQMLILAAIAKVREKEVRQPDLTGATFSDNDPLRSLYRGGNFAFGSPLSLDKTPLVKSRLPLHSRQQRGLTRRHSFEKVAIGESKVEGSKHRLFTGKLFPVTERSSSIVNLTVVGVAPEDENAGHSLRS